MATRSHLLEGWGRGAPRAYDANLKLPTHALRDQQLGGKPHLLRVRRRELGSTGRHRGTRRTGDTERTPDDGTADREGDHSKPRRTTARDRTTTGDSKGTRSEHKGIVSGSKD